MKKLKPVNSNTNARNQNRKGRDGGGRRIEHPQSSWRKKV